MSAQPFYSTRIYMSKKFPVAPTVTFGGQMIYFDTINTAQVGLNPDDGPSPRQPRIAVSNIESLGWEEVAWSREVWIADYQTSTGMARSRMDIPVRQLPHDGQECPSYTRPEIPAAAGPYHGAGQGGTGRAGTGRDGRHAALGMVRSGQHPGQRTGHAPGLQRSRVPGQCGGCRTGRRVAGLPGARRRAWHYGTLANAANEPSSMMI
jgi:hypothetical protein